MLKQLIIVSACNHVVIIRWCQLLFWCAGHWTITVSNRPRLNRLILFQFVFHPGTVTFRCVDTELFSQPWLVLYLGKCPRCVYDEVYTLLSRIKFVYMIQRHISNKLKIGCNNVQQYYCEVWTVVNVMWCKIMLSSECSIVAIALLILVQ